MPSIDIREAIETDLVDIQLCAQQAYMAYTQRMGKDPAPMHADFASQIAQGHAVVAISESR